MVSELWVMWAIIGLSMLVVEIVTVGFFALTVGVGAFAAMLLAMFVPLLWVQVLVFVVISMASLAILRPMVVKLLHTDRTHTAVDRLSNKIALVTEPIDNYQGTGQIRFNGEVWSARSVTGEEIEQDTKVKIKYVDGVKAVVERL